jgi:peroxiredoxin
MMGAENKSALIQQLGYEMASVDTLDFDGQGQLIIPLSITQSAYFKLSVGRNELNLFMRPGDSLIITAHIKDINRSLKYSGTAPFYNDYLANYFSRSNGFQDQIYGLTSKSEKSVQHSFDSLKALQLDDLNQLIKSISGLDSYFIKIEKARALYEWANLHLYYPQFYAYALRKPISQFSPDYYAYLGALDFNDATLVDLPVYIGFIQEFIRFNSEMEYRKIMDSTDVPYVSFQLLNLDKKVEQAEVKSKVAAEIVKDHVKMNGVKDIDSYLPLFQRICSSKYYIEQVDAQLISWNHLRPEMPAKDFQFMDATGKLVKLSDFRGKWVYLDVWASWCSPCLVEIPHLKELERQFQNQGFVFISVSVDNDIKNWQSAIKTYNLKGFQLWSGPDKIWREFYRVSGIPRFMIIDPEGNFYQSSADNPSAGVHKTLQQIVKDNAVVQ